MNAVLSTQPLPDLSPEDQALLARYFALEEDLAKLAAEPDRPDFISLLRWLSRPDIAAYVAAYHTHKNHLHRQAVIAALRTVLSTSTDQIEIRRAATTLLRALNPRTVPSRSVPPTSMPSFRADRREPSVSSFSPSSSTGGGGRAAAGGGSVPTSSTHSPHTRSAESRHAPINRSSSPLPAFTPPAQPLALSSPLSPPSAVAPTTLAEALAILGLPTNLAEIDRLDDEADDDADDAELDAYSDWENNPDPINST